MTLYDELGVPSDASTEELRRAYRGLARRLHPDLNAEPGSGERIRRVNHAWTVLGEPAARERYDLTLRHPARAEPDSPAGLGPDPVAPMRWLRPSVVAIAVLAIIFVATAYAGPGPAARTPATVPSTTTADRPASGLVDSPLVGECLLVQAGYDAIVPCSQQNDGLVVGQSTHSADCPAGTTVHQLVGRAQYVCLAGTTR